MMISLPDIFYDVNLFSTALRLVLAVIFGGIIGLERGANRHPAGFRTHILVCVGSALAILVTGRHKIKGLTTAAGLWASACLGLALGIGFYSGAVVAAVVIFASLALLPKVENHFYKKSHAIDLYIEIDSVEHFRAFIRHVRSIDAAFYETHLSQANPIMQEGIAFHLSMILPKGISHNQAVEEFGNFEGVYLIEEI